MKHGTYKSENPFVTPVLVVPSGDLSFTLACTFSYIVNTHTHTHTRYYYVRMYVMHVYTHLHAYTRRRKSSMSYRKSGKNIGIERSALCESIEIFRLVYCL